MSVFTCEGSEVQMKSRSSPHPAPRERWGWSPEAWQRGRVISSLLRLSPGGFRTKVGLPVCPGLSATPGRVVSWEDCLTEGKRGQVRAGRGHRRAAECGCKSSREARCGCTREGAETAGAAQQPRTRAGPQVWSVEATCSVCREADSRIWWEPGPDGPGHFLLRALLLWVSEQAGCVRALYWYNRHQAPGCTERSERGRLEGPAARRREDLPSAP